MTILIKKETAMITEENLHSKIRNTLNNIQESDEDLRQMKAIWIPQFKLQ